MLLLNKNKIRTEHYFICISIHLMLLLNKKTSNALRKTSKHFNTSNVTIKHQAEKIHGTWGFYFNTSNVTIKQSCFITINRENSYFNTSNVTIKQSSHNIIQKLLLISIHLMLLLNTVVIVLDVLVKHFNTSNVTIKRNY